MAHTSLHFCSFTYSEIEHVGSNAFDELQRNVDAELASARQETQARVADVGKQFEAGLIQVGFACTV
jgi:hypothetical protein